MRRNAKFLIRTICGILALFCYCEYLIYFIVLRDCEWPELDPDKADTKLGTHNEEPVKVMVLADTHLLGSRYGHWFDKLRREWQMHRTFQTAMTIHNPDLVFVLGDLFDEGLYCSKEEFEYYVKRFHSLFTVPNGTKLYVAVGNHDIGFHYSISPYLNQRFVEAFNAPPVQLISVRGNHFVLINSMALEGDGCFLCKPAEQQIIKLERILKCAEGKSTMKCNPKQKLSVYSRPILMQHYPLYRQNDVICNDIDSAPEPIKKQRFRETWECLSKDATKQLLKQLNPRLVMAGHTHHGCTRMLQNGETLEITIPSFSWRNKENPTYGLVVITPNNFAFSRCPMPNENTVINLYMFGGLGLLLWIAYSLYGNTRRKLKLH